MTAMISQLFLQHYWWIIISILASSLVFFMFVQGGQSVIYSLPQNELQKTMIINAMGRKWETTFTTLVTFGGAFFASFPLFYATSFGGAYWVWIAILFSFTIQAISYEYRTKPNNVLDKKTFEFFLFLNGSLGPFLIGVASGTFFTGAMFVLNDMNQVHWATNWYGLEALLNIRNLSLGFAVVFLTRVNGILYIINTIDDDPLRKRSEKALIYNTIPFLVFFLYFVISLLLSNGFAADENGIITIEKYKYFHNLIEMPIVLILFLAGVAGVLYGIGITILKHSIYGIWFTGAGTLLAVFSLFVIAGFNGTAFYPSTHDLQSSLTIMNASSSHFTLFTMMIISFFIPVVIWYGWYAWKEINKDRITEEEMSSDEHKY